MPSLDSPIFLHLGWIYRKLPECETPAMLVEALNGSFLRDSGMRPHEPLKVAFKLDEIHDWKAWLAQGVRKVSGIAGPSAPHWFEFIRRDRPLDA